VNFSTTEDTMASFEKAMAFNCNEMVCPHAVADL